MKIKVRPEDFIVQEMVNIPIKKKGGFSVFTLRKRGWNTVDVIKKISRTFSIPLADFSYGGKKDRYAVTKQYITIRDTSPILEKKVNRMDENYSLNFAGFTDRPMGPDLIEGNRFEIAVRDLTDRDLQSALGEIDRINKDGYPNYFDDQRFGSLDPTQGFIAEKILKGHYNGALKIYLTHIRPEDRGEEKEQKRFFFKNWGKWQLCLERAKGRLEKGVFSFLIKEPKGFIPILQRIPREEMSLFFSAYQSYLWNELLRRIVKSKGKDSYRVYKGIAGDYVFYTYLSGEDRGYLKGLHIPTPASHTKMPDAFTDTTYTEVLRDNKIKASLFNIRRLRQAFFKSAERKAIVIPEELTFEFSKDEYHENKKKLTLKFILPRGSYGTMLVKRLFSEYVQ